MNADLFIDQIPFLKPWLGEEEVDAVREVILSGRADFVQVKGLESRFHGIGDGRRATL